SRNQVQGKQLARKKVHEHVLHHEDAVRLFPKERGRRQRSADLVVDEVSNQSKKHRADHTNRAEAKPVTDENSQRQADAREQKLRSKTSDVNELDDPDGTHEIVAE